MQIDLILLYKFLLTVAVYSLSCVQLFYDPMDCSLPGFFVHVIPQARILEWVVFPSLGDFANPGIFEPVFPVSSGLQADSLPLAQGKPY